MRSIRLVSCILVLGISTLAVAQGKPGADLKPLPVDQPIDLLAMVKLPEHAIAGSWSRVDDAVVCAPGLHSRFMVPVVVAGNYQVKATFTRRTNKEHISLIIPLGGRNV